MQANGIGHAGDQPCEPEHRLTPNRVLDADYRGLLYTGAVNGDPWDGQRIATLESDDENRDPPKEDRFLTVCELSLSTVPCRSRFTESDGSPY